MTSRRTLGFHVRQCQTKSCIEKVVNKQHGQLVDAFHGRSNGRSLGNGGGAATCVVFECFHRTNSVSSHSANADSRIVMLC